MVIALTTCF